MCCSPFHEQNAIFICSKRNVDVKVDILPVLSGSQNMDYYQHFMLDFFMLELWHTSSIRTCWMKMTRIGVNFIGCRDQRSMLNFDFRWYSEILFKSFQIICMLNLPLCERQLWNDIYGPNHAWLLIYFAISQTTKSTQSYYANPCTIALFQHCAQPSHLTQSECISLWNRKFHKFPNRLFSPHKSANN